MGFFADIIRDSRRRGTVFRAPEAPVSFGGDEAPVEASAVADGAPVEPAAVTGSDASVIRLREGGGGQPVSAGQSPEQSGAVTHQVVVHSPSEHTPVAGIPEAMVKVVAIPNPVAGGQTDCESARTETGDFRIEQVESFHDGGSIDVPLVSVGASDSFVLESSSGDAALRSGKVSAETQESRQAGATREGLTTPPEQLVGETVENMLPERAAEPVGNKVAGEVAEPLVVVEEIPLPSMPQNSPPSVPREKQASRPGGVAEEASPIIAPPGGESCAVETRNEPLPEQIAAAVTLSPAPVPAIEDRFNGRATERQLPPLPKGSEEPSNPSRSFPSPEPQVRIGTIEVVVVTPAPAERPPRSEERSRPDLSSRHYLRNF